MNERIERAFPRAVDRHLVQVADALFLLRFAPQEDQPVLLRRALERHQELGRDILALRMLGKLFAQHVEPLSNTMSRSDGQAGQQEEPGQ